MTAVFDPGVFALGLAVGVLGLELKFCVTTGALRPAKSPALAEAQAGLASLAARFDAWPGSQRARSILLVPHSNIS